MLLRAEISRRHAYAAHSRGRGGLHVYVGVADVDCLRRFDAEAGERRQQRLGVGLRVRHVLKADYHVEPVRDA